MFCFKCNPYTWNTFSLEGMAQWLEAGLSDPVSSSPFVPWLMIYVCILNHKEPITNVNGTTSSHPSGVRTLITSTSETGTKHVELVRGCCKLELAAGCVKRSRWKLRWWGKGTHPAQNTAKWAERRGGRWGVGSWRLLPFQLPALNFSQCPHHYSSVPASF